MLSGCEFSHSCVCHEPVPQYGGTGIFYYVCHSPITPPGGAYTPVHMPAVGQHYTLDSAGTCLHLCCVHTGM